MKKMGITRPRPDGGVIISSIFFDLSLFLSNKIPWEHANFRACLHGGGGPRVGEVTPLGWVTPLSV